MRILNLAIVIPTLNEEGYIGNLLDSIEFQTVQPREIVVVDAFSQDQTIKEIKKRQKFLPNLKYFQILKYSISRQRNLGVFKTNSSHILFLDADMYLKDKKTLEKYWKKIKTKKPDVCVAENWPDCNSLKGFIYFMGENYILQGLKPFWPAGTSRNMYVSRKSFLKVKGFDEQVFVGEDMDIVQRMVKKGMKFRILRTPRLYTSTRRLDKDGLRNHIFKMMRSFLYVTKNGYRGNPIEYEFGSFKRQED